ncbi:GGDEF domain-containing protein [Natronincola ferrireducens]|uniref:Diguanylate cyclase (GGDEF) domain-containing protein n=1 Tax=Natronincola ferrireducens TaxID=393762 RepID=A0A1G8XNR7_9FIRM|nr:GGDEF domain-containing protein [Natronincola ferrireducens]SDJ91535.1 diguanylate cyclase (GGDEF) domain-containing protein [Natronincola ferrireducens]
MQKILRLLLPVITSFGFLAVTYIAHININILPIPWMNVLPSIAAISFVLAILLGVWFNKSKIFFIALILLAFYWTQIKIPNFIFNIPPQNQQQQAILLILVVLNLLLFSFFKERGILSLWGKLKFTLLILQGWLSTYALEIGSGEIDKYLHDKINLPFVKEVGINTLSIALLLLAILILIIKAIKTTSFTDRSIVTILLLITATTYLEDISVSLPIFYSTMGMLLIISVISSSYNMAYIDELTQIPSRRALEETLLKLGGQYTIAMLDIDFFKKFNDKYGHDVGDDVLAMVASILKGVDAGGKAFRYGGEEFTIVFSGKSMASVLPSLEKLRKDISQKSYIYKRKSTKRKQGKSNPAKALKVTISIGVAEKNQKYTTPEEVRNAADKALYRAKKKGRNCVSK